MEVGQIREKLGEEDTRIVVVVEWRNFYGWVAKKKLEAARPQPTILRPWIPDGLNFNLV